MVARVHKCDMCATLRNMSRIGISSNSTALLSTPLVGIALMLGVLVIVLCAPMRARRRAEDSAFEGRLAEMESAGNRTRLYAFFCNYQMWK